jgi:hypothetical protein
MALQFVIGALESADLAAGSISETQALERVADTIRKLLGYFRISPPARDVRPSRDALRVAVLLAGQWSLRAQPQSPRTHPR